MHQRRWNAVWRAVLALVACRKLWLTALGRALPTEASRKHSIKAVDRLVGNKHLHAERLDVGKAIVSLVVGARRSTVIVLIDTVEIRHKTVGFVASLAHDGRSLPIYSTVIRKVRANARECRRFLQQLAQVLPPTCHPILLTDGGFESAWFRELDSLGWDYIGRVRGLGKLLYKGEWHSCRELHRLATRRAKNLGMLLLPRAQPQDRRIVLSKRPQSRHRRNKTRRGPDNDSNYQHYRKNAHEPLVLTTSLSRAAQHVVDLYALRMQVEETFRDLKCHRWGWSLRHCRSRSRERIEVLLMLGAIGVLVQHVAGCAGESLHLHHRHQANTIRTRRVLSLFTLGGLLLNGPDGRLLTTSAIRRALARLRRDLQHLSDHGG